MNFEIDVSGHDIWDHNYTIVVAKSDNGNNPNPLIKGHKFNQKQINDLKSRWGKNLYK